MSSWQDKVRRLDTQRLMLALFPRYISLTYLASLVAIVLSSCCFPVGASARKKRIVSALSAGSCRTRNWFPTRKPWPKHLLQNRLFGWGLVVVHSCGKMSLTIVAALLTQWRISATLL